MEIQFYKYQGTGNDFIMINNMDKALSLSKESILHLCDRKFGIGADGLILIEPDASADFYVNYYNSDGSQSFCGNGSRCSVAFAFSQDIFKTAECTFNAIDGIHSGKVLSLGVVEISMQNVNGIERIGSDSVLHTGSPHYIAHCQALDQIDIITEARKIRFNDRFKDKGINVNFIHEDGNEIHIRTYERGVEDETLSCGTGVTAVALSVAHDDGAYSVEILTKGGDLGVSFVKNREEFSLIFLKGPAQFVFAGEITMPI